MDSRIRDVARDLSNSKCLGTTALLYTEGRKKGETEHKCQRQSKTEDWPSESAALNHDRCFCSMDGLNYCNIRGSGAHLSASFVESDTRRGGCSPPFSRGQLDKNNETRSARQKGLPRTLFKINSPCTVWQDDLFLSGFGAQSTRDWGWMYPPEPIKCSSLKKWKRKQNRFTG